MVCYLLITIGRFYQSLQETICEATSFLQWFTFWFKLEKYLIFHTSVQRAPPPPPWNENCPRLQIWGDSSQVDKVPPPPPQFKKIADLDSSDQSWVGKVAPPKKKNSKIADLDRVTKLGLAKYPPPPPTENSKMVDLDRVTKVGLAK